MGDIKIEFAVNLRNEKDAQAVRAALHGLGDVQLNTEEGRVIVHTKEPWSLLHKNIEDTGRRAVLVGFGGQSAVAMINNPQSTVAVQGVIRFSAITKEKAGVVVDGVVDGLTPGLHGLHVHEAGDISEGCSSVGGHYNPRGSPHGSPEDAPMQRHAGDLGNIRADSNGRATFRFIDPELEVWDIIGRAVVITENADDLGRGNNTQSRIDGNSGNRLACGIIARSAGILQNFKKICACDGVTLWDEREKPLAGGTRSQKL